MRKRVQKSNEKFVDRLAKESERHVKAIEDEQAFAKELAVEDERNHDGEQALKEDRDFDKEQAIASITIRKTEVYGDKDQGVNCWPSMGELKA